MISFDEAAAMLDEIAEEIPEAFYTELNGGVCFLPESVRDPDSRKGCPLYILGEYINDFALGNYISIYYGSIRDAYPDMTPEEWRAELKATLVHEFTHHVEWLAGERGLEIKDEIEMEEYRQ